GLGLYMVAVGFLGARPVNRLGVEGDADVLSRMFELDRQVHAWLGTLRSTRAASERPWTAAMRGVADALERGDLTVADRSLQNASGAAMASGSWEALREVATRSVGSANWAAGRCGRLPRPRPERRTGPVWPEPGSSAPSTGYCARPKPSTRSATWRRPRSAFA